MYNALSDTICAVSTPPGHGGIAVIRISGADAHNVCNKIFKPAGCYPSRNDRLASLVFGRIFRNEEVLDEVLVSTFHAPRSYTGEDMVEISCHG